MRLLTHRARLSAPTRRCPPAAGCKRCPQYACPHVNLVLDDGPERTYRLDDPSTCPRPYAAHAAYDPRVHLAYILAQQGHDAHWLSRFTGLPLPAARRIAGAAVLSHA
ncbi:hypothetical protein [Streptomyces orinoci]|uniref:Uncharacterized protein n=1 Tax=Streptomyces orinoci TaxID=67339 RepID=A0ABV3JZF1_STRON|nr:hypothetical protein [Streptomyces orinoci]